MMVYLMHVPEANRVKIGRSKHIKSREHTLRTACPFPAHLVATYTCDARRELLLHKVFDDKRVHGEWFEVPIEEVVSVASAFSAEHERIVDAILKLTSKRLRFLFEITNSNCLGECLRFAIANVELTDGYIDLACKQKPNRNAALSSEQISVRLGEVLYAAVMVRVAELGITVSTYFQQLIAADLGLTIEVKRGRPKGTSCK